MKLILRKNKEEEGIPYDIPPEGITLHNVLGNRSLEARPDTPNGAIRIQIWDPDKTPDWRGKIRPVRQAVLNFSFPEVKFRSGFFGFGDMLRVTRSIK